MKLKCINGYGTKKMKILAGPNEENCCNKVLVCRYVVNRLLINITHKLRKDVVMVVIPYQMKTGMVHSKFIFDMIF
jgi:hypothetical protein